MRADPPRPQSRQPADRAQQFVDRHCHLDNADIAANGLPDFLRQAAPADNHACIRILGSRGPRFRIPGNLNMQGNPQPLGGLSRQFGHAVIRSQEQNWWHNRFPHSFLRAGSLPPPGTFTVFASQTDLRLYRELKHMRLLSPGYRSPGQCFQA